VGAARWVILVAREHADLYQHLRRAFQSDAKVQVLLDRREDESRNPPWVNAQLRKEGVVLIRVALDALEPTTPRREPDGV
jgi:hypothetical protein